MSLSQVFAQAVFEWTQAEAKPHPPGVGPCLRRIQGLLSRQNFIRAQTITFNLHDLALSAPFDHALPKIKRAMPRYGDNLGRIGTLVEHKYPSMSIVDVGANIGDSAAILRHHGVAAELLCVEASQVYFSLLQQNSARANLDVRCLCALVDTQSTSCNASLVLREGTGRVVLDSAAAPTQTVSLRQVCEGYGLKQPVHLIKLDTDGFDGRILVGALDYLTRTKPVLFWEFDPNLDQKSGGPGSEIFTLLSQAGYHSFAFYSNSGDYILTTESTQRELLRDLASSFAGNNSGYYADVCAFSEEDNDLSIQLRNAERRLREDMLGL